MSAPPRHARKRLDITVDDLVRGLARCAAPPPPEQSLRRLATLWQPPEAVVACLSVRSGLDLLLASVDWPRGSEVVLSGLTIPHVATLVRHHGYVPVPVDVDPETLEVDPEQVRRACTERTRALVYAHLLGARAAMAELAAVTRSRGLLLVEDRAECYDGADRALGPYADVALYSFGTIKTATCLGGGVLLVADRELRAAMVARQAGWPEQSRPAYAARLVKGVGMLALGHPACFPHFARLADAVTGDYDRVIRRLSRGYPDVGLLEALRRRPSPALLAVLADRLAAYLPSRVQARRRAGEVLVSALGPEVALLGGRAREHSYWLFPVVSRDPDSLVAAGRSAGFDLTRGSSVLVALAPECARAHEAMAGVVYLPAYDGLPEPELRRLGALVTAVESRGRVEPSADVAAQPARVSSASGVQVESGTARSAAALPGGC